MDHDESRQAAIGRLDELQRLLQQQSNASLASLVDECEQLKRAVKAFHMEAIRFRIYSMERKLADPAMGTPPEAVRLIEQTRADLEAAGFQTRSIER
jgi:hypothetical protein